MEKFFNSSALVNIVTERTLVACILMSPGWRVGPWTPLHENYFREGREREGDKKDI